jgi:ATP-dependent DNA helicase RecQ
VATRTKGAAIGKTARGIGTGTQAVFQRGVAASHPDLWDALRATRLEWAREQGVPPFVIFHDATLWEIAERRPETLDDLAEIHGIGTRKLTAYGDAILKLVARHR